MFERFTDRARHVAINLDLATEGGGSGTVRVAFCSRCGVVLGVRP